MSSNFAKSENFKQIEGKLGNYLNSVESPDMRFFARAVILGKLLDAVQMLKAFFPISMNLWLFSSPCKNFTEKNFFTHSFFFEMQRRHKEHKVADGVDLSCRCYARSA